MHFPLRSDRGVALFYGGLVRPVVPQARAALAHRAGEVKVTGTLVQSYSRNPKHTKGHRQPCNHGGLWPAIPIGGPPADPSCPAVPLLSCPEGGQSGVGKGPPAAQGTSQSPADQTHAHLLSDGAGHPGASLQGNLQELLQVTRPWLYQPCARRRGHLCPHIRH